MAEKRQGGRGSKLLNLLKQTKAGLGEDEGLPPSAVPDKPVGKPVKDSAEEAEAENLESAPKPVARGGGRGLLLSKALSRGKTLGLEESSAASGVSEPSSASASGGGGDFLPKVPEKPVGAGRGSFLAKIKQQREASKDDDDQFGAAALGGRGKYIDPDTASAASATSVTTAAKSGNSASSVPAVESRLKKLSIEEEKAPVVKRGQTGAKIRVSANYVTLKTNPGKGVFEFEVRFRPEIDYKNYRFKLINQHFQSRRGIRTYDGGDKLYMPEKITDDKLVIESKHPNDGSPVTIIVTFKNQMRLGQCTHLYNVLINNCSKTLSLARLGKQHYDSKAAHHIPQHKLEVWPGYVTSVAEFEGGVHLCCDIVHRVLRTETPHDILAEMAKYNPQNFKAMAEKELLGQCVLTRYNNNLYRIDDIEWTKTPESTFTLHNGQEMSFREYYMKNYNLKISDVQQPLLVNKAKKHRKDEKPHLICLIPELCYMTGLTDKMRSDFKVMKDIATYTRVTPQQRDLGFRKFLQNLKNNEHALQMLEDWGLQLPDQPVNLDARILQYEAIQFANDRVPGQKSADWMSSVRKSKALRVVDIKDWIFIFFHKDSRRAQNFVTTIKKVGPGMGIDIADPSEICLREDKIEAYIRGVKDNITEFTQIVVILVPTQRDDRYAALKKLCCKEIPIPSQVVLSQTISKEDKMRPIVQNIALQMNNKLGGAGWAVDIPIKKAMVCGIDSYHDADRKGKSVGAFVASIDAQYTSYFSRTCIQEPRQELIDGLVQCFVAALKKYLTVNNSLPDRIFIFRDGVGDGQLQTCKEYEVAQFLEACRLVSPDYEPKLSFIVVQKRINTRFFMHMDSAGRNLENPSPGSVLDHTITRRNYYDFFLVSQHVRQGTATPSHYIVVYDTSGLDADKMQRLAYKFCHLYYNWPGTIRVPAPCQYAHKLAYLVGQCVKGMPDERLEDKLYYL